MNHHAPILPGAMVGMLGGGQLGRMFTVAARTLGYRVMVLDPDPHSPAGRMADVHVQAGYDDGEALDDMARQCAVITTEFENIPVASLQRLAAHVPVRPSAAALAKTQDRIEEKAFISASGLQTAPYQAVNSAAELQSAWEFVGAPAILKRASFGYDGKGQVRISGYDALREAFASLGSAPCVLEKQVELEREISVVVARNERGECRCYPVAENRHQGGILHTSIVPARVPLTLSQQAQSQAQRLAEALAYCGVLAVEFFVVNDQLLVNEIAPRPHNSGHYTLDACITSQFEQQVRMVCNLPFGDTHLLSPIVMVNLLGDLWGETPPDWLALFSDPAAKLHLYGKREARPGRKMGHFCVLAKDVDDALRRADGLFTRLTR